jgi:hypothetical protein
MAGNLAEIMRHQGIPKQENEEIRMQRMVALKQLRALGYGNAIDALKKGEQLNVDSLDELELAYAAGIPVYFSNFGGR